ncbi:type IV secretion system DNA-binding domain-containing protein [Edaphobacter sp. 12200R-103]|uniref:type IV secretion system DNA-binding domain-containing protein n=1 Tax=Edaphobacter sp. 12200R-103 TaxID=2703788 RepID=UPI00138B8AE1|nr:type IV secretion system DNA-binding domain-containing protein [Edaphobacter sp. 12200R-103]QHS52364.1 type IV secretion system DNA-binding domain-containing protein [Edaphobacter sp. 12200R-103]
MSTGAMRFPSRGRWLLWLVLLLVLGPFLLIVPGTLWLGCTINPVQNFYLGTYAACSTLSPYPAALTTVRYAEKTAPERKPEPLLPEDAVKSSDPKQRFVLSPKAISEGWRGITILPPGKVRAAELKTYLQDTIYDGDSAWLIFLRPILYLTAAVLFLYTLWLLFGHKLRISRKQEQRHGRRTKGPELVSTFKVFRRSGDDGIRFRMERDGVLGRVIPGPSFSIPPRLESSHILLMGDTGSGKSSAIRQILRQVQDRGESAIVYDPAMDFLGEFYDPKRGDLILNPLDKRCPYWGLGDEIDRPETATTIAAAMLPEKEYEKAFFTDAPRRVLAHLLRNKPQPRDILRMMADPSYIEATVKGTPLAALLDPGAPAQRAGVLSSLNMVADSLELLPEWEHTRKTFATAEWYTERKRWVFLTSSAAYREKVLPLHSAWLDLFILRMMGYCEEPAVKPVWFVLDELASLNKLPQLHTAVTENRKYGNPVVMGIQGRSQMEKRYGQDAEAMLSQPATKIFLKTSEPRAAKWISESIGEIEVERLKESRSMGLLRSKKSFAMEIATKPLIMASEIAGLAPLTGFIKLENHVVPIKFRLAKKNSSQPEFLERAMEKPRARKVEVVKTAPAKAPESKKPVQSILPLEETSAPKREGFSWDESKGIE